MASNLAQRVGFAVVAIPAALGVIWLGGWPLALLLAAAGILGLRELFGFAARRGLAPMAAPAYAAAAAIPVATWLAHSDATILEAITAWWPYLAALWTLAVLSSVLVVRGADAQPLGSAAVTVLGPLYCAALPSFLIAIRHGDHGPRSWTGAALVFLPLVVTWVGDSAAMLVGRTVGGPRLAPVISPGKTWSGGVGGVLAAMLAAWGWDALVLAPAGVTIGGSRALLLGAVLGLVGVVGDLAESLFKREAGLKDSSDLIPGHGGVLDRFDSLYFVLPVAAALLRWYGA